MHVALRAACLLALALAVCGRGNNPYRPPHEIDMPEDWASATPRDNYQLPADRAAIERGVNNATGCPNFRSACPISCSFHGKCNEGTGECHCNRGWTGESCDMRSADCPEELCSAHGDCCDTGCCCHYGWTGVRCDVLVGRSPFRFPACDVLGTCVCGADGAPCTDPNVKPNLAPVMSRVNAHVEWMHFDDCHCALDSKCIGSAGTRKLLKFDTMMANIGNADLFIGNPGDYWEYYDYHVCHGHVHFTEWGKFTLTNLDTGEEVYGEKSGSTIVDSLRVISGASSRRYGGLVQGISAGYADWYPYWYDCQWIDVTDLPYGNYALTVESNPRRVVVESDYSDNIGIYDMTCKHCVHGQCDFGTCVCDAEWSGAACDVPRPEGQCVPDCAGKSCGSDGCGGNCGTCYRSHHCTAEGQCECSRTCYTAECGNDNCGVYDGCGQCLGEADTCARGQCVCEASCRDKQCGDDGCGGSCGGCGPGKACVNYECVSCTPHCDPAGECGPDGCGGLCGQCAQGMRCNLEADPAPMCECAPRCAGRECGPDGCGGVCGECGSDQDVCTEHGQCVCEPDCHGRNCGPDGCGRQCGFCGADVECDHGRCVVEVSCLPDCDGRACGDDDCGGSCGDCDEGEVCSDDGECVDDGQTACEPQCAGKTCGDDGCGGSCGDCDGDEACSDDGECVCVPDCSGKACGGDGCGGSCGACGSNHVCSRGGECVCVPRCDGRSCGAADGCGGVCGVAPEVAPCLPETCQGRECGFDGNGNGCGSCSRNHVCSTDGECVCLPRCDGVPCGGSDGCGGVCGECPPPPDCPSPVECEGSSAASASSGEECTPAPEPECVPDCAGKECGGDGCGGYCAVSCPRSGDVCAQGVCVCVPQCDGKRCGEGDGCGGLCGACNECESCPTPEEPECVPNCDGKTCGGDGCGGRCGEAHACAGEFSVCTQGGHCQCVPNCQGKGCGEADGCGGVCGSVDVECSPDCAGKTCGSDGCGGVCGLCLMSEECVNDWTCVSSPSAVSVQTLFMTFHFAEGAGGARAPGDEGRADEATFVGGITTATGFEANQLSIESWERYDDDTNKVVFSVFLADGGARSQNPAQMLSTEAAQAKLRRAGLLDAKVREAEPMVRIVTVEGSSSGDSETGLWTWLTVGLAATNLLTLTVAIVVVVFVWNKSRRASHSVQGWQSANAASVPGDEDEDAFL